MDRYIPIRVSRNDRNAVVDQIWFRPAIPCPMTPSVNLQNTHRAEKSPIQKKTAPAIKHRAAPTPQVSGAKTRTLSSDSNAKKGREDSILRSFGGASLGISGRHPTKSFTRPNVDCTDFPGCTDSAHFFVERQSKPSARFRTPDKTGTGSRGNLGFKEKNDYLWPQSGPCPFSSASDFHRKRRLGTSRLQSSPISEARPLEALWGVERMKRIPWFQRCSGWITSKGFPHSQ